MEKRTQILFPWDSGLPALIIDRVDEEFLLFALEPDGHWAGAVNGTLHRGLAASWLAELMVEGRLGVREGKAILRTKSPIGDPTLDFALDTMRKQKRPKKVKRWVGRLARRAGPHVPEVLERLHGRGHIDIVQKGGRTLYPSHDAQGRNQLRDHLRLVLYGQRSADESAVALLAILDGAGLSEHVFGPQVWEQGEPLLDRILHRDHRFSMLRDIVGRRRKRKKAKQA